MSNKFALKFMLVLAVALPVGLVGAAVVPPSTGAIKAAPRVSWDLSDSTDFESQQPGLGYGDSYRSEMGVASVYVYDNQRSWANGIADAALADEFKEVQAAIRYQATQGHYKELKLEPVAERNVGGVQFLTSHAAFKFDGRPVSSLSYLTVKDGYLVKYRISLRADLPTAVSIAEQFIASDFPSRVKR